MKRVKTIILLAIFASAINFSNAQDWAPTKRQNEQQRLDSITRANEQKRKQEEQDRIAREQEQKRQQEERDRIARENVQKRQKELMQNINTALEQGDCNLAQRNYDDWKNVSKSSSSDIETRIESCRKVKMTFTLIAKEKVTIYLAGTGVATFDWGDGASGQTFQLSSYNNFWDTKNQAYSHTYSTTSVCNIVITGENITHIRCEGFELTSIDVSENVQLKSLECERTQLTNVDVSKNVNLTTLIFSDNRLPSLDVSKNIQLTRLDCERNLLKNLDVSNNINLTILWCSENQITNLDVSKNIKLVRLDCEKNQLKSLDLNKNTQLTRLWCHDNQLTSLNLSNNLKLKELSCSGNKLTSLDLSKNTTLDSMSQNHIGFMYDNGLGITKDYSEAVKWYRKSADQGFSTAQHNLGYMYRHGKGVTENNEEALKWYRKSAEQGNDVGQYNMGFMYENGYGVQKDVSEAVKWYEKAKANGLEEAKSALERIKNTVWGTVFDSEGYPLPAANIVEKGVLTNGTVTDVRGYFALTLKSTDALIVVSFIGYKTQEIKNKADNLPLKIVLEDDMKVIKRSRSR